MFLSKYNSMQALIFKLKVIILFKKAEWVTLVYMILWFFLLIAMFVLIISSSWPDLPFHTDAIRLGVMHEGYFS